MASWDNDPVATLEPAARPWESDPVVAPDPKPWDKDPVIGGTSPTPETDKAAAETTEQAILGRAKAFVQGAGIPTSVEGLKEFGKFLIRNPIQDVKDIYQGITEIPEKVRNIGQTISESPAAKVYRDPLSPESFGTYGTVAGMTVGPKAIEAVKSIPGRFVRGPVEAPTASDVAARTAPEEAPATLIPPEAQTRPSEPTVAPETPSGGTPQLLLGDEYVYHGSSPTRAATIRESGRITAGDYTRDYGEATGYGSNTWNPSAPKGSVFVIRRSDLPTGGLRGKGGAPYLQEIDLETGEIRTPQGGEPNAQQPSNAQVQGGNASLGVETRPEGNVPRPSDSDNVIRTAEGESAGKLPQEPIVDGTAPQENVIKAFRGGPVGSPNVLSTDSGYYGEGAYFSTSQDVAKSYADKSYAKQVTSADITFKKPLVLDYSTYDSAIKSKQEAISAGVKLNGWGAFVDSAEATQQLKQAGYDGVIVKKLGEPDEIVVFHPEKSVAVAAGEATPPKPSKIGQSIEAKAVEAKLTEGFSETALYDPITIADQAQRATQLVESSPDTARAIIRGDEPLPQGLRGTSLITAMEENLLKKPDPQAAYELANSPLTSATSAAAQEMRLMAERVPDSITAKFEEIRRAREAGSRQRGDTPQKVAMEVQREIVKNSSKRPTWEAFVREITCA